MGKLEEIGYELAKTWKYLTRQEICDYFGISDRTLYRYQDKLNLTKEMQTNPLKAAKYGVSIIMNTPDNKVKQQNFKSWEHFAVWTKAQAHPYRITEKNIVNIDYSKITDEAKQFLQSIK